MTCKFPPGFTWGAATAATQIEGAASEDGKGPSVWDRFTREHPERVHQAATPEVACDHYHRYLEDVRAMADMGHNGYRMSIAWPRLFPQGDGALNQAGVDFYQRLFDALLTHNIEPTVTLYHWDLPDALGQAGGWVSRDTVSRFLDFARTCFEQFGDRVKRWVTVNEPAWTTLNGYITGLHPPNRSCDYRGALQVAHHFLVAHALAVQAGRAASRELKLGIALNLSPIYPATAADKAAAVLADGMLNRWFLEPVLLGRFPDDMWACYTAEGLLPDQAERDLPLLAAADLDFLGVNYYYPHYASADAQATDFFLNTSGDAGQACRFAIQGQFRFVSNPRGRYTDWNWEIHPAGLTELLLRAHRYRPELPLYVTENGIGLSDERVDGKVDDQARIAFVREHLEAVHQALEQGVPVKGYFMWSLMDNFSWLNGYKKRYGFLYVDRDTLDRTPKESAAWFREVALSGSLVTG